MRWPETKRDRHEQTKCCFFILHGSLLTHSGMLKSLGNVICAVHF